MHNCFSDVDWDTSLFFFLVLIIVLLLSPYVALNCFISHNCFVTQSLDVLFVCSRCKSPIWLLLESSDFRLFNFLESEHWSSESEVQTNHLEFVLWSSESSLISNVQSLKSKVNIDCYILATGKWTLKFKTMLWIYALSFKLLSNV
jgi:hypothetical protein